MELTYSIYQIDKEIIRNLPRHAGEDVLDNLKRLFKLYKNLLKQCIEEANEQEALILKYYKSKSYKNCRDLIKIYSEYMNGNFIAEFLFPVPANSSPIQSHLRRRTQSPVVAN